MVSQTKVSARERSVQLAEARGETPCSHKARTLGWTLDEEGGLVSLALEIRSAHQEDVMYTVGYSAASDDASCDCKAAQFNNACWHRGLGIIMGRQLVKFYAPTPAATNGARARSQRDRRFPGC